VLDYLFKEDVMAEYSRIAKGSVVTLAGGGTNPIYLPFLPDRVEFFNYTAMGTPTATQVVKAKWDVVMGQGAAAYDLYASGPAYSSAVTTTGGISTFQGGLLLQFGAKKQVVSATKSASPTSFVVTAHGYKTGDVVVFQGLYQTSTTGMPQICNLPFAITVVDANTFTIVWNTSGSNYTSLSASPTGATVMQVLFPSLYIPGVSFVEAISLGTTTQVTTTSPHNLVVGQEVAFRIPSAWGTTQLNSLPNSQIPGSPIYGYVVQVVDSLNVVVSINSSSFTAFNVNQPVASVSGQNFPQMVAVGDVNTGGAPIYSGSPLYPPPQFLTLTGSISTINGPAIQGAFVNNTAQGFTIGSVVAPVGSQTIYWEAYLDDFSNP